MAVPRCLTIAGSDSGGGAGIQADLKAFAAAGCFGMTAIVALTAQNTLGVTAVQELPPAFVEAQLQAVFDDIGVDAAKTGMLFSRELIDTVADFLARAPGAARRRSGDGRELRRAAPARTTRSRASSTGCSRLRPSSRRTFPRPRRSPARSGSRPSSPSGSTSSARRRDRHRRARRDAVDHLFDGREHVEIEVERHDVAATHGAGCTHSATLAALLARGESLEDAARGAARVASEAVRNGLTEIGAGEGPVNVLA